MLNERAYTSLINQAEK